MAKTVSIDIGSKTIKIVEGTSDKKNLSVKRAVKVNTPLNAIQEGYIKDYESIRNILRQTLSSNGIKTKNAVFNINTTSLITRTVELPVLKNKDETVQMIRFELEQFLPVVLDEYKIVFRIIKQYVEDGIKKGSYLIYAVPTKLINDYRHLAENIGLKLISMDLSFNSLEKVFTVGRTINGDKIEKDKAYYVLEMGHKSLIFNVMYNNNNLFTRLINLGGSDIDVNIENIFDMNRENAIKLKHKVSGMDLYQLETPEDTSINNIITTNLTEWMNEINRVMQYFTSRNKDIEPAKLLLYGGSSRIKNAESFFEDNLGIDTTLIESIGGFSLDPKIKGDKEIDITDYLDAAAGLLKTKSDMNLLSDLIRVRQTRLRNVFSGTLVIGLLALALVFYYLEYSINMYTLNNEIAYYNSIIDNPVYQSRYREVRELERKTNVLRDYKDIVTTLTLQLSKTDAVQTGLLIDIASTIPVDTNISNLTINGNAISIQGTAVVRESVAQLQHNLKNLDFVESVYVPGISGSPGEDATNYSFTVNILTKGVE